MQQQDLQSLLKRVEHLLENELSSELRELAGGLHPSQIANLLEALPSRHTDFWNLLDAEKQGHVLLHIESTDIRRELIAQTDTDKLAQALGDLPPDEQADLFEDIPKAQAQRLLSALGKPDQELVEQILIYNKDTAGGIMHPDTITVRDNITIGDALKFLRELEDLPLRLDRLFVVDECNRYKGILRVLALLKNTPDTPVKNVMEESTATIHHNTPVDEVALLFDNLEILRAPVIDDDGTLLGHIVADDVIDIMGRRARTLKDGAALLPENESLFSPIFSSLKRRGVWLSVNLLTALLASFMISLFENTLEKIIALAILLPIVASMGGIAGSQTLTLVVRGIATGKFGHSNFSQLLTKEIAVGLSGGLVWAIAIGALTGIWFSSVGIGLIISGAVVINLSCATAAGVIIPYYLHRTGIDPAISSGVLLTTVTDIVGIIVFLGLGTLFLL